MPRTCAGDRRVARESDRPTLGLGASADRPITLGLTTVAGSLITTPTSARAGVQSGVG